MHLLVAQRGSIADEGEAVDLGQEPADICVLSAADTELAALADAQNGMPDDAPSMRLASLLRLSHALSMDTWIDRTARHAKLVVVRALGGKSYAGHALEALHRAAARHGFQLAVLPGDQRPDMELRTYTTVDPADATALWQFLCEGGAENANGFIRHAGAMIGVGRRPAPPRPVPAAGIWKPGEGIVDLAAWQANANPDEPRAAIVFYRALAHGGQTAAIDALAEALSEEGLSPLPIFVASLKDEGCAREVRQILDRTGPKVVLNATAFATSQPGERHVTTVLDRGVAPVLQVALAGSTEEVWRESARGLSGRDLAMNVALPELDGRIFTRAISFKAAGQWDERTQCDIVRPQPVPDRLRFVARLARNWASIPELAAKRRVAIVLANYPNRDGRIGNGVGLDTPAGTVCLLAALREAGYALEGAPQTGDALLDELLDGVTNAGRHGRVERVSLPLEDYQEFLGGLPDEVVAQLDERWGTARQDRFFTETGGPPRFVLPFVRYGKVAVGIQPSRGYDVDPKSSYHDPDLVPPHGYLAFYAWLRANSDAVIHMGKHGNQEWLPGKALALSETCFPEATLGPMPNIYPFIVNDPGEGSQAKRRAQAVIIDHLTPPLTRAESHGPMRELEALVDEYFEASATDERRTTRLVEEIVDLARRSGVAEDIGLADNTPSGDALQALDGWLCELKEMQIRDGLHVFGRSPEGRLRTDLLCALARVPRGEGEGGDAGLTRALAADLGLRFDPLDCELGTPWTGERPEALADIDAGPWRTAGDTVERLEELAAVLVGGERRPEDGWTATNAVLERIDDDLGPSVDECGPAEIEGILDALNGRFVRPGPSGAPTRGRPEVLPTGRNFHSVDTRSVPTRTAWELGRKSAELVIVRHLQDEGDWLRAVALTCWGTSCMRTGGDDIAQALALLGVRPVWDVASQRVTGFEIITLAELGRPRVDVTLRISGFFRDAFPDQIALFDRAARAVGALDEPEDQNPVAARMAREGAALVASGHTSQAAEREAGHRVFGSKPGAYGAGLQALIDDGGWTERSDLAEAFLVWGAYAYGASEEGIDARPALEARLGQVDALLHNQDNREHDLLDSDDYYQFEGGMSAAVEALAGHAPTVYHNDHSRPESPKVRTLDEEIARVVRARVTNPKWIAGVMRHGYKGAFEIAASVDYLFAFAATTNAVRDHHFDAVHEATIGDDTVRRWMDEVNPNALKETEAKLAEAVARGLWNPRSNSARARLMDGATANEEVNA